MTQQQTVLSWLKDAHAAEVGGLPTLRDHAETAKDYPEMQSKLSQHATTTERHAELLEGCIKRLGGSPSALKEAVGSAFGKVAGLANLPAKDTVVKNALGDYAAENFEVACYTSLVAAAEGVGDHETADVCKQILGDEEEMAGWLKGYIPTLTQTFLTEHTGDEDSDGPLADVGQKVAGLGKKTQEAVTNVDPKNALLAGGALLAGAGAALLVGQALRGGKEQQPDEGMAEAYVTPPAAPETAFDGSFVTEIEATEVDIETESVLEPLGTAELPSLDGSEAGMGDDGSVYTDLGTGLETDLIDADMDAFIGTGSDVGVDTGVDAQTSLDAFTNTEVWSTPGPYSGLGPVYSDMGDPTGQEVASRLTQHGQIDASSIEITVDDGEVLLEGSVDSEETKRLAQEALESVAGVSSVQNLLNVQGGEQGGLDGSSEV